MKAPYDDFPELLTEQDAAALLRQLTGGVGAATTLRRLRCVGGGPRFMKLGARVRYRREDLVEYVASRLSESIANTAQAPNYRPTPRRNVDATA